MNLPLFAFSMWKHFVTFNELEHWMEEDLDFTYAYCWACSCNTDKKMKVWLKESEHHRIV